jgi:16S rRNA (cytidine1402-2'-O)-methyltransferase
MMWKLERWYFMIKGKLYLIPVPLGTDTWHTVPAYAVGVIHDLRHFIVEKAKTARHFIKETTPPYPISDLTVWELEKQNDAKQIREWLGATTQGHSVGLMSEAGCPGVADPGAVVVLEAHRMGIEVVPLVGPSSILLSLMASGMSGQNFCFLGYLSAKRPDLDKDLKRLEGTAKRLNQTQIFIETPYRNRQVIEQAIVSLNPTTLFCIAADITLPTQFIQTKTIADWKKAVLLDTFPELHKRAAIFLIL